MIGPTAASAAAEGESTLRTDFSFLAAGRAEASEPGGEVPEPGRLRGILTGPCSGEGRPANVTGKHRGSRSEPRTHRDRTVARVGPVFRCKTTRFRLGFIVTVRYR